jgi:hypothetical protein
LTNENRNPFEGMKAARPYRPKRPQSSGQRHYNGSGRRNGNGNREINGNVDRSQRYQQRAPRGDDFGNR